MKKLSTVEKMLIDITDTEKYNLYRCEEDGIFTKKKGIEENDICSHCGKVGEKYVER